MNKINYDALFIETVGALSDKKSLLLHACCAPCSSAVLERVTTYFNVTLFFYNPNITDETEYCKRLVELKKFVAKAYNGGIPIIDGGFEPQDFFKAVNGLEGAQEGGERCSVCYAQRLSRTAALAKEKRFDYFCTTLSVSPYKDADKLNGIGGALAKKFGVEYLYSDFKKRQGYVRSIELSKEYGLYRQNYCGCVFSRSEEDEKQAYKAINKENA